jgi:hypothetical protein
MTYGVSASSADSWPAQLGRLLGEPVYNMGLGGYGPLQYLFLAEHEASKLRPQILVVAFYFGNDLVDAYRVARSTPYWRNWRVDDSAYAVEPEYERLWHEQPRKRFASLRDWLSRHSVLYSVVRVTVLPRVAAWERDRLSMDVTADHQMIWVDPSNPAVRTIFTPQLRLSAVDPQLPSVQEGLRITKRAFSSLKKSADAQRTQLLVLLIPTKERAYCRYLEDSGSRMPDALARLCAVEQQVKEDMLRFFEASSIAFVDVTGAMEEKIRNHVQIFPTDADAHPQANGYGVIARAVYDAVRRKPGGVSSRVPDARRMH